MAIEDNGFCYRSFRSSGISKRPCIFFDRDGVLIVDSGYIGNPQSVILTEGCKLAVSAVRESRYASAIVTNQSGIGRGYYSWSDFEAVQKELSHHVGSDAFDAVYACGYHERRDVVPMTSHSWRKPNPGMLLAAATDLDLDMRNSWIIGDRYTDLLAGARAGLAGGFILGSPLKREISQEFGSLFPQFKVSCEPDVYRACLRIIKSF
ncbi:HAD-IIIA family hydrolase (plasmid) [Rhizobium sp. CB3090]|nr:HAD-IIIA family hydrolase [Rhizobium sp. CB3090]WFU12346.1 HAD-IIIA family hydrolase [Rhizobium sp. CB3090]